MNSKYGLSSIKDDEALLLVETAMQNGSDPQEAIEDMKMIDNLLTIKRNHLLAFGSIKTTSRGFARKGTSLFNGFDSVVTARSINVEM